MTPATITDPELLRNECDVIVERDYARDAEEFVAGLNAVSVPVRDKEGMVRATIAVHAPTARMTMEQAESRLPLLRQAAAEMGKLL